MSKRRGRGEGGVCQRDDGRWMGTLDLGYVDGRRRRKSVYGATRKAVTDRLTKLGRDRQLGLPIPNETSTLARFLES